MAYLVFTMREGEEIGRRPLNGAAVIGRSSECDIALHDRHLSRRHCRLMPSEEGWVLSDLDSRNGTHFRGHPVSRHVLRDGQVFQIGLLNVIFRAGEMAGGDEVQGCLRPRRRPASPWEPAEQTEVAFNYEPPPAQHRTVDHLPVPIPTGDELNLDWLNFDYDRHSDRT